MQQVKHNGAVVAFEDVGRGAPPILLIHDLGADRRSLQHYLASFRMGHRVVAVDLPGHGGSSSMRAGSSPAAYAEEVAWCCYELGLYLPVAVCRGAGGVIAAELAAAHPDLLAAVVALDQPLSHQGPGPKTRAALGRCPVPVMLIVSTDMVDVETAGRACPGVRLELLSARDLNEAEMADQVHARLDAVLAGGHF